MLQNMEMQIASISILNFNFSDVYVHPIFYMTSCVHIMNKINVRTQPYIITIHACILPQMTMVKREKLRFTGSHPNAGKTFLILLYLY